VFRPEEIYFPPYDFTEIVDILGTRVQRGFYEDVVSEDVLNYVATLTAEKGDLRVGIDLLRRAGLNAERRASREVIIEDIDKAYESSKYMHLSQSIQSLTDSEKGLLHVLVDCSGGRAGDVYEVFHEQTGLGYTRYSEIVNKLEKVGVIAAAYKPVKGRGRSREIELVYKPDAVKVYLDRYSMKS
jgi:cell division control protein 6